MRFRDYMFSLFLCLTLCVYGQNEEAVLLDSMSKEVERAYDLFDKFNYGDAIKISQKVIDYAEATSNDHLKAKAYNVLGNTYYNTGNDSLCFDYLFKSRDLLLKVNDIDNAIKTTSDIGVIYREYNDIEKANLYFNEAIDLGREYQNKNEIIYPLYNYGRYLHSIEDYKSALAYFNEAYELSKESELVEGRSIIGYLYLRLNDIYNTIGDKEKSASFYKKGVEYTQKHKLYGVLASFYRNQSNIYYQDNKTAEAFTTLRKYTEVADTIYTYQELEIAKQAELETNRFLKENEEKLQLANQEKELQATTIKKAKVYNTLLIALIAILLLGVYAIFKKNKQLKIAKEKAEELSKVKSKFYSEISHELRTPLYAVIELSRLLLKENVNSSHKEYLESLNFSGNHLLSLINNVLQLNKVESGRLKIEFLEFEPKNMILSIIESLEYALRDSKNKIQLDYDTHIPELLVGDSLKLSQVLINLISNAIKFTSNGTITITTKLLKDQKDEVSVFFAVKDDGIGISRENQAKIFEEFYQERSNTGKTFKGTGLGLSIVKRTLDAMGSAIKIDSVKGEGATFSFELQLSKSAKSVLKDEDFKSLIADLSDKTILVVDDNKINLLVTKKILNQYNIASEVVDSGKKAIELVKETSFDCILMDIHMPELDGYETTTIIRKFDKETPIVALTATSTEEVESQIYGQYMSGYILKPFITAEFIQKIHCVTVKQEQLCD